MFRHFLLRVLLHNTFLHDFLQHLSEQQDNGNSTGMAGSEQNSKAVRTKSEQGKLSNQDPIHVWTDPKDGKTYVLS